eukprot:5453289-Amphidinium_carterae.1
MDAFRGHLSLGVGSHAVAVLGASWAAALVRYEQIMPTVPPNCIILVGSEFLSIQMLLPSVF